MLSTPELCAWKSIKDVIHSFLGKNRSPTARMYVDTMLSAFEVLSVNMSTKIHFFNSHMDYFEQQLATESDEHGERFHHICAPIEERYKSKSIHSLIAELCWTLFDNDVELSRTNKKRNQ